MKISKKKQLKQSHRFWRQEISDCVLLSDVKKIITYQCDLHFYECLAEYVASLNLRNVA